MEAVYPATWDQRHTGLHRGKALEVSEDIKPPGVKGGMKTRSERRRKMWGGAGKSG